MATNTSKGMDTGTKGVIGLASVALLLFLAKGCPDDDAWESDEPKCRREPATSDDRTRVDLDLDEDDDADVPARRPVDQRRTQRVG